MGLRPGLVGLILLGDPSGLRSRYMGFGDSSTYVVRYVL